MNNGPLAFGISLLLSVVLTGCRDQGAVNPPAAKTLAAKTVGPSRRAPKALLHYCRTVATPVSGRTKTSPTEQLPAVPPVLYDDPALSAADRRLRALEALDNLKARLEKSPRDAQLHHQLGVIFRDFMEHPEAALGHFCRALIEAPQIDDYRLATLNQLTLPGQETKLELALRPGDRTLPWRLALAEIRQLANASDHERGDAFSLVVRAQRMLRTARSLNRRRIRGRAVNLVRILEDWAGSEIEALRVAIAFPRRHRARVRSLRDRSQSFTGTYAAPGPANRWMVLAENNDARGAIVTARRLLSRLDVGVSAIAGHRQIYVIGRFGPDGFTPRYLATDPHNPKFELQLVVSPATKTEK